MNERVLQSLYTFSSLVCSVGCAVCVRSGDLYLINVLSKMAPNHLKIGYFFFASGGWGAAAPQTPRDDGLNLARSSAKISPKTKRLVDGRAGAHRPNAIDESAGPGIQNYGPGDTELRTQDYKCQTDFQSGFSVNAASICRSTAEVDCADNTLETS